MRESTKALAKYKAKYMGKSYDSYDRNLVYLEYEYRGRIYEVYEHKTRGNEPLRWQHLNNQATIDKEIELEEKIKNNPSKAEPINWDEIFKMLDWE